MKRLVFLILLISGIALSVFSEPRRVTKKQRQARFDSLILVNRSLYLAGEMDEMPKLNKQLLLLAEEIKEDSTYASAYFVISNYFTSKADYAQALDYCFKSIEASKEHAKDNLSTLYANLANVYSILGNYSMALQYLHKGQEYFEFDRSDGKILLFAITARVYNDLRKPDSALKYAELAQKLNLKEAQYTDIERKQNYNITQGNLYRSYARAYDRLDKPELANYYFKKGIRFCDSANLHRAFVLLANDYCSYLVREQKYTEAKNYGIMSFETSRRAGYKKSVATAANLLYHIHKNSGRPDSAYYFVEIKNLYLDSLAAEQKDNQLQSLITNQQLHEAEQNAKAAEDKQHRDRNIEYAVIASGIIVCVILFMLLSRRVVVKGWIIETIGAIGLLIVFEFINLVLHPVLERITNHSPWLMLLILVAVGAGLVPLHHNLEKRMKTRLAEKNAAIRLAAAQKAIEDGSLKL